MSITSAVKCTIQIFNDPLAKEITSSSGEDPTSCFVVRARRRLRTRLKRKSCSSPRNDYSGSSASIADTESWPTEELDEEEEVIHVEVDDGSEKLLLKDSAAALKEKKRSRVRRILAALTKISWLGKGTVRRTKKKKKSFPFSLVTIRANEILLYCPIGYFCAGGRAHLQRRVVFSFPFRGPIARASGERRDHPS